MITVAIGCKPGRAGKIMAVSSHSLTVLTAVDPDRAQWMPDTAASIATAGQAWPGGLAWVLVVDGPGQLPDLELPPGTRVVRRVTQGGPAAARNTGLPAVSTQWLLPLDADDLLDVEALPQLATELASIPAGTAAVAASPRFLDGTWTAHRIGERKWWSPRELEESWTAPFAFHPNCVLVDVDRLRSVGGWPAAGVNEDLALMLWLNRSSPILAVPEPLIRYRVSDEQMTASSWYPEAKQQAFAFIAGCVNADRAAHGLAPVRPPAKPGGGYARESSSVSGDTVHG
jgi:glycosyltransferase involved in cell wall biosynthesis